MYKIFKYYVTDSGDIIIESRIPSSDKEILAGNDLYCY